MNLVNMLWIWYSLFWFLFRTFIWSSFLFYFPLLGCYLILFSAPEVIIRCEVWIGWNGIWIWSWIQHRCSHLKIISCFIIYWNLDAWMWPWFWNVDSSFRDVVLSSFNLTNNCMASNNPYICQKPSNQALGSCFKEEGPIFNWYTFPSFPLEAKHWNMFFFSWLL